MAADSEHGTATRGKAKKKSALTKLVERKKRQVGSAEIDTDLGSQLSLQGNNTAERSHSHTVIPLEPEVIVEKKTSSGGSVCIPCKFVSSDSQEKPRPRPRRNSRTAPPDDGLKSKATPAKDVELEVSGYGDSKNEAQLSGRNAPTDSTIYRFRNMRMAADQSEVSDSKLQGPFVPKPPSTPRTPRSAGVVKGEKRNHEPASSGDEREVDLKRQTPEARDSAEKVSPVEPNAVNHHKHYPGKPSPDKKPFSDGYDVSDPANETLDQLHSHYQRLMTADTDSGSNSKESPMHMVRHNSFGSQPLVSSGMSTPRSGRLAPLQVKNVPPPLEGDMTSLAMRTAYKADLSYRPGSSSMLSRLTKASSEGGKQDQGSSSHGGTASDNISMTSASVMPVITTKEARSRSYLVGSVNSGTILGTEELERYFPDRRARIFVGSWNMNELKEMSVSLNDFILPDTSEYVQDIYVVGTQENELTKKEWEVRLQETLGPSHVLYHSVSFGCLHLAIFIRRDLIWFCTSPEEDMVSLRAVSMVKTKGAVAVSFSMFGTSFLFINAHLTSDRTSSKNKIRLLDYHRVIRELRLPHVVPGKIAHPVTKLPDVTARFDCVFWCGDLNFRLERRRAAVESTVTQMTDNDIIPHFEELLGGDQLSKYITEGKIFEGFQEGRINFQPTFKFDVNSDKYDSSSKRRIPSYTQLMVLFVRTGHMLSVLSSNLVSDTEFWVPYKDRVLFRTRKKNSISCLHYDAVMDIRVSDHRAVYAMFEVTLRPGSCLPLSAGQFDRDVYLEANKRRSQTQHSKGHKNSSICVVQ